jgi:hypothetical protein
MSPRRRGQVMPFPGRTAPVDGRSLVELYRCDQAEAVIVKSLFESHGIRVVLRSRLAQSVHPFSVGDQGTITILVPEADAVRARDVLKAARLK